MSKSFIALLLLTHLFEQAILRRPTTRIGRFCKRVLGHAYWFVRRFSDPVVRVKVGDRYLYVNTSHALPQYTANFPYYDTALPRLCAFLERKRGYLTLIDVGANIGDSVSSVASKVSGTFLCIEADTKYVNPLEMNVKGIDSVTIETVLVSDVEEELSVGFVQTCGTSRLARTSSADRSRSMATTVDKLVQKHPAFARTNIIKVDTDGYDYKVIRGSSALIREANPVIYFEFSPEHLKLVAGEDPISIFDFVSKRNYSNALFYDHTGLPLMTIKTAETATISMLLNYASIKGGFYYDVLLFHDSQEADFLEFCREETQMFPVKKWF
jgi:FkbM family methyltransferase